VNERLPSRETALKLLSKSGCSRNVIRHCETAAKLAVDIAEEIKKNGLRVDVELVEIGALLHDIGRSETHGVDHGLAGAKIAESMCMPEPVVSIIKRHIGGGISGKEAKRLGWPDDIYVPQTLEEKIVCYADKRVGGSRIIPLEETIREYGKKVSPTATDRIRKLHLEMTRLAGDCTCLQ
jgi:uncharacterized protein